MKIDSLKNRIEKLEQKLLPPSLPPLLFFDLAENDSIEFDSGYKCIVDENGKFEYFENGKPISENSLDSKIVFINDIQE